MLLMLYRIYNNESIYITTNQYKNESIILWSYIVYKSKDRVKK